MGQKKYLNVVEAPAVKELDVDLSRIWNNARFDDRISHCCTWKIEHTERVSEGEKEEEEMQNEEKKKTNLVRNRVCGAATGWCCVVEGATRSAATGNGETLGYGFGIWLFIS